MPNLTDAYVKSARFDPRGNHNYDMRKDTSQDAPKGFYLRIYPTGTRGFVLRRTLRNGKKRVWTFPYPEFGVEDARKAATDMAREVLLGGDPNPIMNQRRRALAQNTLAEARAALELKRCDLSPHTQKSDRVTWARIEGVLDMDQPLNNYNTHDLQHALGKISASSIQVQAQNLLRFAFELAIERNWCTGNPADTLGFRHKKTPRKAYLGGDDLGKLAAALEDCNQDQKDILLIILYLGLRRGEAASLDWTMVDWGNEKVVFKDHKSATHVGEKHLPLNGPALSILRRRYMEAGRPEEGAVLPYNGEGAYTVWRRVRKKADLSQFSLHDLRRTFAVEARRIGVSIEEASVLLGHNNTSVTERHYAHPIAEEHRAPSERVARSLEGRLNIR